MSNRTTRILLLMILDTMIVIFAGIVSLVVRFEFHITSIPQEYMHNWLISLPFQIVLTILVFYATRLYHFVWHYVNSNDVVKMFVVITLLELVGTLVYVIAGGALGRAYLPKSVIVMTYLFKLFLFIGMRCSVRFMRSFFEPYGRKAGERILLIGAGSAADAILREIQISPKSFGKVCAIIDDNPVKKDMTLHNVRIVGGREKIHEAIRTYKINKVILAIPTLSADDRKEIIELCRAENVEIKVLPGMYQLYNGEVSIKELRDVQIEDLLGRDPIKLGMPEVAGFIKGKTVLVTGGGGSIGSELCRQIATFEPEKLVVLDIYENNAYDLQQELVRRYGKELNLVVEIASVRDKDKIYSIFEKYRPAIVFHAAAHKHVPLMEDCPDEAIKNNVFGTFHVVRAAEKYGVKKFIMISTDKAVNPTNLMGATKRFCEMILQSREESRTEFASVRFGNVLGSNGSVVPLFKKQIAEGGPVTITDKRITRFFMTIPEAVQLVLEAGAIAKQKQVFVLDMGEPVKIIDLAENMIRLSGKEPYTQIEIKEIGLRPGEKLYEELLMKSEHLSATANNRIFVEEQEEIDKDKIYHYLESFDKLLGGEHTNEDVKNLMKQAVVTYREPGEQ